MSDNRIVILSLLIICLTLLVGTFVFNIDIEKIKDVVLAIVSGFVGYLGGHKIK